MRTKQAVIGIIVILLAISGYLVYLLLRPKANVIIKTSPSIAQITVDGKKTSHAFYVKPSSHVLRISFDNFITYEKKITADTKSKQYVVVLAPSSKAGETWLENHPREQTLREALASEQFSQISESLAKNLPVANELPHIDNYYRVDLVDDPGKSTYENSYALKITFYSAAGKQDALKWLKFKGVDTTKTTILYFDPSSAKS